MDEYDICHNLMQWVETFPGLGKVVSPQTLSDGLLMAKVLHLIDSNHFTATWLSRLKEDCGDNRRLKFSNLRKVHQTVVEYLQYLGLQTLISADISKISDDSNAEETGKMLQLILGCAMNCNDKERHIESIMAMPADVQAVVMNTLQTMFVREASPGVEMMPTGPASFHPNHRTITEQLETTTRARDEAVSRVHELEMQLSELSDQHSELKVDNEKLLQKLEGLGDTGDLNSTASGGTVSRYKDLKKKIDTLQDDLFKVETSRDEYRSRVEDLQSQHADMLARTDELQKMADLAHTLQDEVDVLKDMGQRATQAESTIESYKKKLDELSDLKRQNKLIEEKNADYMQHILELEEDIKKNGSWRPQLEMFKKQTNDLRQMLSEETKKADRLSFENKKLQEKVEAITLEKDRVCIERETLREQCEDLRCENSVDPRTDGSRGDLLSANHQEMWEKVIRLQHENQQLKKQQTEGLTEPVLQAMVSDLTERHDNVATENRQLNQRIMELESEVEEQKARGATGGTSPWSDGARKDMERKLALKNDEITQLQESLQKKEGEMSAMEERYKKYLVKAKSVIKTLNPSAISGAASVDQNVLRQQLLEKDRRLDNMERDAEKMKMIRDVEEKLITSAFYNFGMSMHRQMTTHRLSALDQGGHHPQQKQRHSLGQRKAGNRGSGSQLDEMRFS